ncbi:hypothetical protein STRCI_008438 [Streptomyces cinnabarinus]|uniref:Trypsin-co-occurring domain-containing protein n=1 Tax=Streptomyces cinnabarinus TaxID=67287 RepID=A0ABY7KUL9_9ACTN|nr:CU044_2847 family protein [Streptomyces cinnabarinus]WAZ26797.1 hypothetical protein STRCI_008438 [Streptomyces cinnabarinus]
MSGRLMPMRIGDVEVLVETTAVPGSENTSALETARERVADAYQQAQETIVAVASTTVDTVRRLAERSARPDQIEVEFGLAVSASGNIIVAGASADATLNVRLTYTPDARSGAGAGTPARRGG